MASDKGSNSGDDSAEGGSLDDRFDKAVEWLGSLERLPHDVSEVLGGRMVRRIVAGDTTGEQTKRRAIFLHENASHLSLFEQIQGKANLGPSHIDTHMNRYGGEYGVYRFFKTEDGKKHKLTEGRLKIELDEDGKPYFKHWSEDYLDGDRGKQHELEPENQGYVFASAGKLFFLGWRANVLRLGIGNAFPDGGSKSDSYIRGVMVSIRHGLKDPFGAQYLMVHDQNTELQSALMRGSATEKERVKRFKDLVRKSHEHILWA